MVEWRIGKIANRGQIMLLYAKRFWSESILHILWPFTGTEAINVENNFTLDTSGCTPLKKITVNDIPMLLHDKNPLGYPVYVLERLKHFLNECRRGILEQ